MKNDRHGKAAVLTDEDYSKIRRKIRSHKYKVLLDLAWYTGERWGALVQLRIEDVYNPDGSPRENITFRARTRKASPDGKRKTRQVPVHPTLYEVLQGYQPDMSSDWLFPSKPTNQCEAIKPIALRTADLILRQAVGRSGLEAKGISTHSTRRSFITNLAKKKVAIRVIQQLTGHSDLKVLSGYIEVSDEDMREAIAVL
jgi:integrase/recombinase XerD